MLGFDAYDYWFLKVQSNVVAYEEGSKVDLEKELFLSDAISDLPLVCNMCFICF